MRTHSSRVALAALVGVAGLLSCFALACGSADGPPLGGPYGGVASTTVGPTSGTGSSAAAGSGNGNGENNGTNAKSTGITGTGSGTSDGAGSGTSAGAGSGSGSGESAVDAGSNPPVEDAGSTSAAPTWSSIYKTYLAAGTEGNCGLCHGEMSTASGSYGYLTKNNQLGGATPPLVSASASCLSWMGGNMPPLGPSSDATATSELQAWAAAGAQNN